MRFLKEGILGAAILGLPTGESMASKQLQYNDLTFETFLSSGHLSKKASSKITKKKRQNNTSKILAEKANAYSEEEKENMAPPNTSLQHFQMRKRKNLVPTNVVDKKKKPRLCQEAALKEQLQSLQQRMKEIHNEPEYWKEIFKIYQGFQKLNYSSDTWDTIAKSLIENAPSFCRFPQQTSKEAVGGYLFYPSFINDWVEYKPTVHLLERFDILWSFAVGAKLKDARCQYYLGQVLDYIWENEVYDKEYKKEKPTYIRELFKKAFAFLPKNQGNEDACYIIGRTYYKDPHPFFGTPLVQYDKKQAIDWSDKGQDFKNKLQALKIRKESYDELRPILDEYMILGRQGYEFAFIEAAKIVPSPKDQLAILEEGKKTSKGFVFLEMGYIYEEMFKTQQEHKKEEDLDFILKSRECYLQAGKRGLAQGYIELGKSYVGNPFSRGQNLNTPLKDYPEGDVNEAIKAFTKAGELQDYQGWEYLAKLYDNLAIMKEEIRESLKENNELKETLRKNRLKRYRKQAKKYFQKSEKAAHKANTLGSSKYRISTTEDLELMERGEFTTEETLFIKKFGAVGALIKLVEKFLNL